MISIMWTWSGLFASLCGEMCKRSRPGYDRVVDFGAGSVRKVYKASLNVANFMTQALGLLQIP